MKRLICFVALMFALSSCDVVSIKESGLPNSARVFIATHFPNITILNAQKGRDNGTINYDVTLENGTELEFDEKGTWLLVDCNYEPVPQGIIDLIPSEINAYFTRKYPETKIIKIKKEIGGYEISADDLPGEFHFNAEGEFISHDEITN